MEREDIHFEERERERECVCVCVCVCCLLRDLERKRLCVQCFKSVRVLSFKRERESVCAVY